MKISMQTTIKTELFTFVANEKMLEIRLNRGSKKAYKEAYKVETEKLSAWSNYCDILEYICESIDNINSPFNNGKLHILTGIGLTEADNISVRNPQTFDWHTYVFNDYMLKCPICTKWASKP
jgi:hypothetical protein